MCVDAEVHCACDLKCRRWAIETFIAKQGFSNALCRIIDRLLRVNRSANFDETTLSVGLCETSRCTHQQRHDDSHYDSRRNACNENSSSFIGTLYWSFSIERIVWLFRLRSCMSILWAVQMP